jgi:enoyl-CoA hydratase/carnithine racemase
MLAAGPTLAHAMTKRMLHEEWSLPLDDAIDAEARAQATLMESNDFKRAYEAFTQRRTPVFEGN